MIILLASIQLKCAKSFKCEFINSPKYTCNLKRDAALIREEHLPDKSNDDVVHYIIEKEKNNIENISYLEGVIIKFRNIFSCDVIGIKSFKGNIFQYWKHLTTIKFSMTSVEEIPESFFEKNTKLSHLEINRNEKLTTLPENIFSNQKNLVELSLYRNKLKYLASNIFKSLTNLQLLDLNSNLLNYIDSFWFEDLKKLKTLYLCCNGITELDENVFKPLVSLEVLHLYYNGLTILNSNSFGNHQQLTEISVINNKISSIDEQIIDKTTVKKFYMAGNICNQNNSETRDEIMENLKECFQNYKNQTGTVFLKNNIEEAVHLLRNIFYPFRSSLCVTKF